MGARLGYTCEAHVHTEVALQRAASIQLEATVEVSCCKFSEVKGIDGRLCCTTCGSIYSRSATTDLSHEEHKGLTSPFHNGLTVEESSAWVSGSCSPGLVVMARLTHEVGRNQASVMGTPDLKVLVSRASAFLLGILKLPCGGAQRLAA